MSRDDFFRVSHDVERLAQLRHDVADVLGRLVTECAVQAKRDPPCANYYEGEARYWDGQRTEAIKTADQMLNAATHGQLPITHQTPGGRIVQIGNVAGDVVISTVEDSDNVIVGKGIEQRPQ